VVERGMNDETHGAEGWIVEQSSEVTKRNAAARRVIDVTRGADGWAVHPSNNERSATKHNAAHGTRGHGTRDAAG
jgi:hypothetical protein